MGSLFLLNVPVVCIANVVCSGQEFVDETTRLARFKRKRHDRPHRLTLNVSL
jgi:hypothetical protein